MGEIVAFLIYIVSGIYLANVVISNSNHVLDEFEELIAVVVLAVFWPVALVAMGVIILDDWLSGR